LLLYNEIVLLNSKDGVKLGITPVKSYNNLHLKQTQYAILTYNKQKACVYLIYNTVNGNSYIGSATSNRINMRFRNHCIHSTGGSKPLTRAIHKYGLNKFSFHIIEYFTGFVQKENFNKNHLQLLALETSYLLKYKPIYNILPTAGSSVGLKHTAESINKMKSNYSDQRREFIRNLNKDKALSDLTKKLMSDRKIERFKDEGLKAQFLLDVKHTLFPKKQVFLYDSKGVLISQYDSVNMVSQIFSCDRKTVRKYLDNPSKMFKNIGYLKTSMTPATNPHN
jgi:group I intron endonuclease